MDEYQPEHDIFGSGTNSADIIASDINRFMSGVLLWMISGLAVSAGFMVILSYIEQANKTASALLNGKLMLPVAGLALAFQYIFFKKNLKRTSLPFAKTVFLAFSAINGFVLSVCVFPFTDKYIIYPYVFALLFFVILYGFNRISAKNGITEFSIYFAAIAAFLLSVVSHIFNEAGALSTLLSYAHIGFYFLLIGRTSNSIKTFYMRYAYAYGTSAAGKTSVIGAFMVYNDGFTYLRESVDRIPHKKTQPLQ